MAPVIRHKESVKHPIQSVWHVAVCAKSRALMKRGHKQKGDNSGETNIMQARRKEVKSNNIHVDLNPSNQHAFSSLE